MAHPWDDSIPWDSPIVSWDGLDLDGSVVVRAAKATVAIVARMEDHGSIVVQAAKASVQATGSSVNRANVTVHPAKATVAIVGRMEDHGAIGIFPMHPDVAIAGRMEDHGDIEVFAAEASVRATGQLADNHASIIVRGARASVHAASVVIGGPYLQLAPLNLTALPAVLSGVLDQFIDGETVTFHLDAEDGPVLVSTMFPDPFQVLDGGYGTNYGFDFGHESRSAVEVTVTIPGGTPNGLHTVYAVGSQGSVATAPVIVAVPIPLFAVIGGITFPYAIRGSVVLLGSGSPVLKCDVADAPKFVARCTANGVDEDPTEVSLLLMSPAGVVTTYIYPASVTRDAKGRYSKTFSVPLEGTWLWRWVGEGAVIAADEGELRVRRSQFV